jgi:hypothetical protein
MRELKSATVVAYSQPHEFLQDRADERTQKSATAGSVLAAVGMSRWPRGTLYSQKLALTAPTSGARLVGIVRSRTQATEFSFSLVLVS